MLTITITFGIGLTLIIVTKAVLARHHSEDWGKMGQQWVAIPHTSQPTPSI